MSCSKLGLWIPLMTGVTPNTTAFIGRIVRLDDILSEYLSVESTFSLVSRDCHDTRYTLRCLSRIFFSLIRLFWCSKNGSAAFTYSSSWLRIFRPTATWIAVSLAREAFKSYPICLYFSPRDILRHIRANRNQ